MCIYAHTPMHTTEIWKKCTEIFLNFMKELLSLNRDKYFALCWCFCVRISFIILLIKWSEMDTNMKPQTFLGAHAPRLPQFWGASGLQTFPLRAPSKPHAMLPT